MEQQADNPALSPVEMAEKAAAALLGRALPMGNPTAAAEAEAPTMSLFPAQERERPDWSG
jgi:hypothetical protein